MPKLHQELARELRAERYDLTPEGIYFPRNGALVGGIYYDRVNGGEWTITPNIITDQGFAHLLNVALGATPKPAGYYLAIHNGSAAPAANWTAANYPAVASEIVSLTEGYTGATRPVWTPAEATAGVIDNLVAAAEFTIASTGTLNVTGAAMLTSSQRGGTTGVLVSAMLFPNVRQFQDGDKWELGYRLTLTR